MGDKLNAISLFSGIGGFELGLSDYCRTVLYCENDSHAQAVLLSRMSEGKIDIAPISTDVKEITGEFIDIPIDIIMGGFPCQDISCAGKGVGLEGERSGLFFEIMRLAKEIKPKFLFLENVSAIRTRGLDRVIQELTEIAKHKRERWFLLANTKINDGRGRLSTLLSKDAAQQRSENEYKNTTEQSCCSDKDTRILANPKSDRSQGLWSCGEQKSGLSNGEKILGCNSENCGSKRSTKSDLGRVVDGISFDVVESQPHYLNAAYWQEEPEGIPRVTEEKEQRVERIKRLGNAVVPLQVRTAFEYLFGIIQPNQSETIYESWQY